jgi:hypothetical protein
MVFNSGSAQSIGTQIAFLGPTATVNVAGPAQKVLVIANQALGTTGNSAIGLNIWICYQSGSNPITSVGPGVSNLAAVANTKSMYGLSSVITGVVAGTYQVGLCGSAPLLSTWNFNDFGTVTAIVSN